MGMPQRPAGPRSNGNGASPGAVQLEPGMHARPGPYSWAVAKQQGRGPQGEVVTFLVLHIEHQTGSTIIPLMPEHAKALGHALTEQAGGLTIAQGPLPPMPRPGG